MRLPRILAAAAALFAVAGVVYCAETVELAADSAAPAVEKTATSKELSLVLPVRFFRAKGDAAFSTPFLADLYYTTDGGASWKSYGLFKDLDKPISFTADSEGRYGFFVTLLDQKGNSDVIPVSKTPPQITVLFDWTPPEASLISPAGGEIIGGQKAFDVKWKATDEFLAETPISLEYSTDGGSSWTTIAKGLENSGTYAWTPAIGFSGRALVRVVVKDEVGHVACATSRSPLLIDTTPPTATVTSPTLAAKGDVPLDVITDDLDGSGIADVALYVTLDNGSTWAPAGKSPAGQPLVFHSSTGKYGLYATATDKAGNTSAAPQPGQAPQLVLTIDVKTPLVRLKTLNGGGVLAGGSQTAIEWEAVAANPSDRPISIYVSPDGGNTWAPVATDIVNSGTFLWDVPRINSQNCLVKVVMKDSSGTVGAAKSAKPFVIDSTKPTSAIGIPPSAAQQPLADLSTVMAPVGCPSATPAAPLTSAASETPKAVAEAVESTEPAVAIQAPGVPAGLAEGTRYQPETTLSPMEPWTGPKEQPRAAVPMDDASFEDVLKAAFAAYKEGQMPIAKEYFKRAVTMDPKDPRPHAALGRIYAKEGSFNFTSRKQAFEAALYEFEKAIELSGGDADVYNDMGFVLLQSERYRDAANAFRKATETGSKPVYWYNLGLALYKQSDLTGAAAAFAKALEAEPDMKEANFYMGKIASTQCNWQDAKAYWGKAVDGYGPGSEMGKVALSGLTTAREKLGEVEPQPTNKSFQQKMDRIR